MQFNPVVRLLIMIGGLLIWGLQFTVAYGGISTICARGWGGSSLLGFGIVPLVNGVTMLVCFILTAGLLWRALALRQASVGTERFMADASALIAFLSLPAIIFTGLPGVIIPSCA